MHMSEQKYPEPTVGALIFNKEGKLLVVKSPKWFDKFIIPGGHVELGETAKDALKREIKEEVGLEIREIEFLQYQDAIFPPEFAKRKHFVFIEFSAKCVDDKVTVDNDEITHFRWVDPVDALKMDLASYTRRAVEAFLNRRKA